MTNKMPKIQVAKDRFDANTTMVWYLNEDKCAVCVEVEKDTWQGGYELQFRGKRIGGFRLKADAVAHAKKMLKWAFEDAGKLSATRLWG